MSAMISLQRITKTYQAVRLHPVTAVNAVDLEVEKGEFVMITGRSGSGKTTLLNLAAGLTTPTSGKVLVEGVDLWTLSDGERSSLRNRRLGFVFQFPSLMPTLTVLENIVLPTTLGAAGRGDASDRALQLLQTVGLTEKVSAYPRQLSAGQQQRVVLARSLINRPEVLLADEPSSNLDERTEQEIMLLFKDVHARTGVTILMVTHTSQLVGYGTRAIEMAGGSILPG
jgi:ABC-type lipoprotein export system ATPase subunit